MLHGTVGGQREALGAKYKMGKNQLEILSLTVNSTAQKLGPSDKGHAETEVVHYIRFFSRFHNSSAFVLEFLHADEKRATRRFGFCRPTIRMLTDYVFRLQISAQWKHLPVRGAQGARAQRPAVNRGI